MGEVVALPSGGVVHVEGTVVGAGEAPLLFLHGVGGAAWSFAPQREGLGGERECFTWEGRGHGLAPPASDAGLGDYYRDAEEALALAVARAGRPPIVVAHSMGGLIALALACTHPASVGGLFLVDPVYAEHGAPPVALPRPVVALLRALVGVVVRSYLGDGWLSRAISRAFFRWAFHDRAAMERAWQHQRARVPLEYPRMLFEAVEGVTGFPFRPFADEVRAPVHIVEAAPARAWKRARIGAVIARLRARLGPAVTSDAIEGGHYLQLDRPAEVTAALAAFARRAQGAAPSAA